MQVGLEVGEDDVGGGDVDELDDEDVGEPAPVVGVDVGFGSLDGATLDRLVEVGVPADVDAVINCVVGRARFFFPASQVSMNSFQVLPGRSRPYSGAPEEFTIGAVESPLPTQTAAATCGVNPTIHASLLPPAYLPVWMPSVPVCSERSSRS